MVGAGIGEGLGCLIWAAGIGIVCSIIGLGYFLYNVFIVEHKTFKTTEKPAITWELKAHEKTVDTVWIYKFK